MESHLRAGVAVYNAGQYHAAHDAWEDHWLDLEQGTDDEQFLHGLIQFTAAVHHARTRNWSGATGLASSARDYLGAVPATYRGLDVADARRFLAALATDPERIERGQPPALTIDGDAIALADLAFEPTTVAAEVLAEEHDYDTGVIEQAATFARADLDDGQTASPFVTLLFDFTRTPTQRPIIAQRLSEHTQKRAQRADDVAGLFDA
ncbi:protein of unknown function [Halovenus aranensis]|uniref:DUF309 domain-containing protein n=1 Tax=Halovenus aranensis TaxID=890420 RepID=A0A1G8X514_9EURY|nr:DUF309 domain-containing protein [Halovenus aranensis]SDJ85561.1 protein of unknown function [Halovenus aranensis]